MLLYIYMGQTQKFLPFPDLIQKSSSTLDEPRGRIKMKTDIQLQSNCKQKL